MPCTVPRQRSADTSNARSRPNQTTGPACRSPMRRTSGVVAVQDRDASGAEALEDLRLGVRDGVERREELEVHRRHQRDDGRVRPRDARQRAELARRRHAELEHGEAVLGREAQQRQGQAVLVVEVPLRLEHGPARPQQARGHLLGGRLAGGAGDGRDRDGGRRAHRGGEAGQRARGVVDPQERQARAVDVPVHDRRGGAALPGLREELVPVEVRSRDGHEQRPGRERARVDGDGRERGRGGPGGSRTASAWATSASVSEAARAMAALTLSRSGRAAPGDRAPPGGRRTAPCGRAAPGTSRGPCRR